MLISLLPDNLILWKMYETKSLLELNHYPNVIIFLWTFKEKVIISSLLFYWCKCSIGFLCQMVSFKLPIRFFYLWKYYNFNSGWRKFISSLARYYIDKEFLLILTLTKKVTPCYYTDPAPPKIERRRNISIFVDLKIWIL